MLKLTLRNLKARKLRLAMTLLAVVLGVGFVCGTFVLTDTMNAAFDNLFADVTEGIDVFVRSESEFESQMGGSRRPVDDSLIEAVRQVDGVRAAAGSVGGYAQFVDKDGEAVTTGGAPTLGTSWYDEPQGSLVIREGRPPSGPGEVVVDAGTAGKHGFEVGDRITVLTQIEPREYEVTGIAGLGEEADSLAGATLAVFDLATAQEVFQKPGRVDTVDVAAEDGVSVDDLRERLEEILPEGVEAADAGDVATEQAEFLKEALSFFNTVLLVFGGIAVFVGAFLIFNTFSITVAQRTREFALLRALGASGRQVTGAVFLEALLIGILASGAGIAAGFGIAAALNALLAAFGIELPNEDLVFLPRTAVVAAVVGIGVTLVSSIAPARRAARISPMAALRESTPRPARFSARRTAAGLLLTLLGGGLLFTGLFTDLGQPVQIVGAGAFVTFLGVATLAPLFAGPLANLIGSPLRHSMSGKLARRNAARNPKRTAATAAALMIGLALVGLVSILGESVKASTEVVVDSSLRADFTVAAGGFPAGFLSPAIAEQIDGLPEVEVATPLRLGQFRRADERGFFVAGIDPASFEKVAEVEVTSGSLPGMGEGELFLHTQAAADQGLEVGDRFAMEFAATGRHDLTVAGLFDNKSLVETDYLIDLRTFEQHFPEKVDIQVYVKIAEGVTPDEARKAIDPVIADYPNVELHDQTETKQESASQINQLLAMINALLGLALVIALFGITNTLALSVYERTRELGLLRAVGMARAQARGMIRWEAMIIAIIGAVLGLGIGLFFGWALVTSLEPEGITELRIPYGQLAGFVLVAAVAGVVAALPPARRAARLNVLEAISTE